MRNIVVIQCAGSKTQESWTWHGQRLKFVADRLEYQKRHPASDIVAYEPDDFVPGGADLTWRQVFLEYYETRRKPSVLQDADELCEAWKLYRHPAYQSLVCNSNYGRENVFILSAGWGLVNADYQLPPYNITFSPRPKEPYATISCKRLWQKLQSLRYNPLSAIVSQDVVIYFFGGKGYRELLFHYTDPTPSTKVVFYKGKEEPSPRENYRFVSVDEKLKLLGIKLVNEKWPYECAQLFLKGELKP